jgi:ATP-dependent DNA helicase RecG
VAIRNPCALLDRLLTEPGERDWLEFKVSNADPQQIGEYVSALANSAMLADREKGYLVFGIENETRRKVGTTVVLSKIKGKGAEGLANWLSRSVEPPLPIEYLDFACQGLSFAVMCIEPSYDRPVKFQGVAYIRIGEHKKRLDAHTEIERALWLATSRRKFEDAVSLANQEVEEVLRLLDWKSYFTLTQEEVPGSEAEIVRKLEKIGAIRSNMEGGVDILNLGAILFANDVDRFPSIKGKSVRVIKYKGLQKGKSEPEQEGKKGYASGFRGLIKYIMNRSSEEAIVEGCAEMRPFAPKKRYAKLWPMHSFIRILLTVAPDQWLRSIATASR